MPSAPFTPTKKSVKPPVDRHFPTPQAYLDVHPRNDVSAYPASLWPLGHVPYVVIHKQVGDNHLDLVCGEEASGAVKITCQSVHIASIPRWPPFLGAPYSEPWHHFARSIAGYHSSDNNRSKQ